MVDIHCHALYGVDDGAHTLDESIDMLRLAYEDRIREMIVTPHYRVGMFPYPKERIEEHFEILRREAERVSIHLFLGCEYHVDHDMVDNLRNGRCATLAGSRYVLAEFSTASTLMDIRNGTDALLASGYIPVIAHAERYEVIRDHPEYLTDLRAGGIMVQLNAGSILGEDGRRVKAACARILKEGNADVIASDAHNTRSRRCRMKECRDHVAKKYGRSMAKELFNLNPWRILKNG